MWEENCETVQVTRRLTSEERREESGDSDDDFVYVDQEESSIPLLPLHSDQSGVSDQPSAVAGGPPPPSSSSIGDVLVRVVSRTRDQTRPESILMEATKQPIRLVLSSWGHPFSSNATGFRDTDCGVYGLLRAESPRYLKKAEALADKFEKASGCTKISATKWERPDLKLLYWFNTALEYQTMAKQFKEGKMRDITVNKEKYRAVSLEPVRVIDSSLKAFLSMDFPSAVNTDIKHTLKQLFDPVSISHRFLFIPSNSHQDLSPVEDTDSSLTPSLVVSLITNVPDSATARRISDSLSDKESWAKFDVPFPPTSANSLKHIDVFRHSKYQQFLPLISLMSGQAGWNIDNGIRITLFCGSMYSEMVEFYSLVLNAKPVRSEDHVIFLLMESVTSLLELVLCNEPSMTVVPLNMICMHFISTDMLRLVAELSRRFGSCDLDGIGKGVWHLNDPFGNRIAIHDHNLLEKLE